MQASSDLSLAQPPKADDLFASYRRRLAHSDGSLGRVVNGDRIEFQFSNEHYTILATSYDYFEGCDHWIYLLSKAGKILDLVAMPYIFGLSEEAAVVAPHELAFKYFGTNDWWSLSISQRGYWSFSAASLARRMNRFFLSRRHLTLRLTKGAPWVIEEARIPSIERKPPGNPAGASHVER